MEFLGKISSDVGFFRAVVLRMWPSGPAMPALLGNLILRQILSPTPDLQVQKLWGYDLAICVLTSFQKLLVLLLNLKTLL